MADDLLSDRVERLEKTVEGLQTLPAEVAALGERVGSVETQILELRAEMHIEFSSVRSEMQVGFVNVKTELREEMHEGFAAARDDMLVGLANVTREIRETAEEGKRHSRMLFEEALGRIATLGEDREGSPHRRPGARRRKR